MAVDPTAVTATGAAGSMRRPVPHRLRLLFVGPGEPPWGLLALRLESAGCAQAEFDWETEVSAALARLRKTPFDCVVVRVGARPDTQPFTTDGFVEALRASGSDDPLVVLLEQPDDELTSRFEELDCELLVSPAGWQSRALVAMVRRAVARGDLRREMAGLEVTARRGRLRERDEADSQLEQLQGLIARFRQLPEAGLDAPQQRPETIEKIHRYYRELLRTYVMMGSGNLADDVQQLAELLALAGLSTVDAMSMHLDQLQTLLQGLGNRSSRHVMARADLLALELMILLGEQYRRRARFRGIGDAGIDLMHAESLLQRPGDHHLPEDAD